MISHRPMRLFRGISALVIKMHGPLMLAPGFETNGYHGAGGSSASSPAHI